MPRKEQGWITFQTSDEERRILEEFCHSSQRTKTEILRELVRGLSAQADGAVVPPSTEMTNTAPAAAPIASPPPAKKPLKVSSRNVLRGKVTRVISGAVNSEITLEILHPVELISIITKSSVEELGLVEGVEAYAVIKSSDVVIAME
ncbi:TOBE domain-containing protein [Pantanalinema sp. GBBB05]|uniref:TOBE domain-containing protein n=1 Tax=Pantanalinema sp. GBBB05 TaxID=2604139 RepID=UPI001E0BF2CB|nr:transporter [Pantanalinema sp. GBBB05]